MLFWLKDKVLYAVLASLFQSLHFDLLLCDCALWYVLVLWRLWVSGIVQGEPTETSSIKFIQSFQNHASVIVQELHLTSDDVLCACCTDRSFRSIDEVWSDPKTLITNLINITDFNEVFSFNYIFITNDSMWACSLTAHNYVFPYPVPSQPTGGRGPRCADESHFETPQCVFRSASEVREGQRSQAHSSLSFFKIKDLVQTKHRCETLPVWLQGPQTELQVQCISGTTHSGNGRV